MRAPVPLLSAVAFLALAFALYLTFEPAVEPTATQRTGVENNGPTARYQLRLGHNINEQSALHAAAVRFAEEVRRASGGEVEVTIHPNQQLGTDQQMLEMARRGELDLLLTPTAKLSAAEPAMQYADLPFYFDDREELYAMLDGAPGRLMLDRLSKIGLIGVTFWENGFKHFTANRPITRPEDFAGLRIRTMKSPLIQEQFRQLGATPVAIDFHATRQALADGVVDGQENPLVAIVGMGFHEVQPHLTLSGHGYLGYVFSISAESFKGLTPRIKQLLIDTARDLTEWEREETHRREERLLERIRAAGVAVHQLSAEQRLAFREQLSRIPHLFEREAGPALLAKTGELRWERLPAAERDRHILVGIDADLSAGAAQAGLAIKRGVELAVSEINAEGGVLGRPLAVVARDHMAIPVRGQENIRYFAERPQAVAVVGGLHSWVVLEELDALDEAKLPMLVPWAAASKVTENGRAPNYVFRVSVNDRYAGPFLVDSALADQRKIGLLLENSVWGRGNEKTMRGRLAEQGLTPTAVELFNRGDDDFAARIGRLAASGAEAILMVANPVEGARAVKAMAERPLPLPIIAHWGIVGGDFWNETHRALTKVDLRVLQTFSFLAPPTDQARRMLERYLDHFGEHAAGDIPAPTGTAHAYDLIRLLARAIERAGNAEPAAVRDALERLDGHDGVLKRYAPPFTAERHDALTPDDLHLARFDERGHIVMVE